jgi:predicted O-linked N-acetylglucosamine transferase (SPINDLY family)
MKSTNVRAGMLADLADAELRAGDRHRGEQLLADAASLVDRTTDPLWHDLLLQALAETRTRFGQTEQAMRDAAAIRNPETKAKALTNMVRDLVRAGRPVDALAAVNAITAGCKHDCEDLYTAKAYGFVAMAAAQVAAGKYEDAKQTLARASEQSATREVHHIAAIASAKLHDWPAARREVLEISDSAMDMKVEAARAVEQVQVESGDVAGAKAWTTQLSEPGMKAAAWLGIAEGLMTAGASNR